jgi:hypothetical protein
MRHEERESVQDPNLVADQSLVQERKEDLQENVVRSAKLESTERANVVANPDVNRFFSLL